MRRRILEEVIGRIFKSLEGFPFSIHNEKLVQKEMSDVFNSYNIEHKREVILKPNGIIDFMVGDIGIEVKVKGGVESIYKQCKRYCDDDRVKVLVLVTARCMGFPKELNGKPCYYFHLSKDLI